MKSLLLSLWLLGFGLRATPAIAGEEPETGAKPKSAEERIAALEARVRQLEKEVERLSKPAAPAESKPRVGVGPSEDDRRRWENLSETGKEKLRNLLKDSREKLMNLPGEERRDFIRKAFEKIEAEDNPAAK